MFFIFNKKRRQELDDMKSKKAEMIVADTLKELNKATKTVKDINHKAAHKVTTFDIAERLYYATRRNRNGL